MATQSALGAGTLLEAYTKCREKLTRLSLPRLEVCLSNWAGLLLGRLGYSPMEHNPETWKFGGIHGPRVRLQAQCKWWWSGLRFPALVLKPTRVKYHMGHLCHYWDLSTEHDKGPSETVLAGLSSRAPFTVALSFLMQRWQDRSSYQFHPPPLAIML